MIIKIYEESDTLFAVLNMEAAGFSETLFTTCEGGFTHNMPRLCRSPTLPCVNSHMPCRAPALLRQCRVLRESSRGSRKYPNCQSNSSRDRLSCNVLFPLFPVVGMGRFEEDVAIACGL